MGGWYLQVDIDVPATPGKYDMHASLFKKGADKKSTRSVRYLNVE